ncbi:unnamed protein product, partial [Mesorhabditis spiculigera]
MYADSRLPWTIVNTTVMFTRFGINCFFVTFYLNSMVLQITSKLISVNKAQDIKRYLKGVTLQVRFY